MDRLLFQLLRFFYWARGENSESFKERGFGPYFVKKRQVEVTG